MSNTVIVFSEWDNLIKPTNSLFFLKLRLNLTSLNKRHILVFIDFVKKWVESRAISFANEKLVVKFLFSEFFTGFGVPRETFTNNGSHFVSNLVKGIMN